MKMLKPLKPMVRSLSSLLTFALLYQLLLPYEAQALKQQECGHEPAYYSTIQARCQYCNPPPEPNNPDPDDDNDGDDSTDDPIDTKSGSNYFSEMRLFVDCPGIPLEVNFKYKSVTDRVTGSMGKGWTHSYEWVLDTSAWDRAELFTGDGKKYVFKKEGSSYKVPASVNWELEKESTHYRLTLPGGIYYIFSLSGTLMAIQDAWGNQVACGYNSDSLQLESVTHSNGRSIIFSNVWHASVQEWRVSSIAVDGGVALHIAYEHGRPVTIDEQVDDAVYTATYRYDADGNMTHKINRAGMEYHYTYDAEGRGTSIDAGSYYPHSVTYNDFYMYTDVAYTTRGNDQFYRYQRNQDKQLTHKYGPSKHIDQISKTGIQYGYNERNDKTTIRHFDDNTGISFVEYQQYDDAHNITNRQVAYGDTKSMSFIQQEITRYDNEWQLPSMILEPDNSQTDFIYDRGAPKTIRRYYDLYGRSHNTQFGHNNRGQVTTITNPRNNTTTNRYDEAGNLEQTIPPAGPQTFMQYNDLGYLTNWVVLSESGETTGRATQIKNDAHGRPLQLTHADGLVETFSYNGLGYLMQTTDRAGRNTDYTYVPGENLTSTTRYLNDGGTSTPVRVGYDLDEQTNVLRIEEPSGEFVESYQLDIQNRVTSITNIEQQVMHADYKVVDFINYIQRFDGTYVGYDYNAAKKPTSVTYHTDGQLPSYTLQTRYHPDGRVWTRSDGTIFMGHAYDLLNQLTNTLTRISGLSNQYLFYQYDANGNRTNTRFEMGTHQLETTYQYDAADRKLHSIAIHPGATNTTHYTYSPLNGTLQTVSNTLSGITTHYQHDLMDQLTNITYRTANGSLIKSIAYQRDAVGMITKQVHSIASNENRNRSFAYDSLDRLINEYDGETSVSYRYDLRGNRTAKIRNGVATTYTLGAGNRLDYTTTHATNLLAISGMMNEPIGLDDRWGDLYITNLTAQTSVTPSVNGNQFFADVPALEGTTNWVVSAIRDRAGNMGYCTNAFYLPLTSESIVTQYDYDEAGNLTQRGDQSLAWDLKYRLTHVTNADASAVSYGYDILDRLASRTDSSSTEHYVYDGHHVIADLDGNGNLLRSYTHGLGIDAVQSITVYGAETNTYTYLRDPLNSVLALVDAAGEVVESYSYDAYGNTKIFDAQGVEIPHSAIGNRYMFQGREYDTATGLYNFRARWYDPEVGRWISKDPIGIAGGLNQYVAFNNNPVNYVDPEGTRSWGIIALILGAIAELWDNNKDHYEGYEWDKIRRKKSKEKEE